MLSIVMKIYNEEDYIEGALLKLLPQLNQNDELLLIDDGSTDKTEDIITKVIADRDLNNVKYYKKENGGPGSASSYGLEKAVKDYVMIIDADDELGENTIQSISDAIKNYNPDVILYNRERISLNGDRVKTKYSIDYNKLYGSELVPKYLLEFTSLTSNVFKKSLIDSLGFKFLDVRIAEDINFLFKTVTKANRFVYIEDAIYRYFERENSLIHSSAGVENNLGVIDAVNDILDYYTEEKLLYKYEKELYEVLFTHMFVYPVVRIIKRTKNDKKLQKELVLQFKDEFLKSEQRFTLSSEEKNSVIKKNLKHRVIFELGMKGYLFPLNFVLK